MTDETILKGQVLSFTGSPFDGDPTDAVRLNEAVVIRDGRIINVGGFVSLRGRYGTAKLVDHGSRIIMAGFVDAHVHFPQTAMIASWGKRLIDWLNSYTFPEEMLFADAGYATEIAERYLDITAANGTTTMSSFCTIHPESVDAFFTAAQARGQRVIAGKTCMDRNAPDGLRDTAQTGYDQSRALLNRWHGVDRISYAITPRFSPTSTPEQLEAMGALWAE
ncbi:MAG: guanine deaminase, partial [Paracoccaceae bacterium]